MRFNLIGNDESRQQPVGGPAVFRIGINKLNDPLYIGNIDKIAYLHGGEASSFFFSFFLFFPLPVPSPFMTPQRLFMEGYFNRTLLKKAIPSCSLPALR